MKHFASLLLVLSLVTAFGCVKKDRPTLSVVPPPPAYDSATAEGDVLAPSETGGEADPFASVEDAGPVPVEGGMATDAGVEPVQVDAGPVEVEAAGTTYVIQKGDTLWGIAKAHYGDGKKWQDIADANPDLNTKKLRIGQEITLP